jgi:DNA-binding CsgD family transcriptional regulator
MSTEFDKLATGFDGLYGTVAIVYGPNPGSIGSFGPFAGTPPAYQPDGWGTVRQQVFDERGDVAWSGQEPRLAASEAAFDLLKPEIGTLTRRQRDVLTLIVQGRSNKEIARALNLAHGTVKTHVAALFSKLGINRRAAVAVAAARLFAGAAS